MNHRRSNLRIQMGLDFLSRLTVFFGLIFLVSCGKVTLEVERIPTNTPAGASVFVSGNFNFWDAGDGNFRFTPNKNGKYYLDFPAGWGEVEYKFSRGDWTSVEADGCGHAIKNRTSSLGLNFFKLFQNDTLRYTIYSWEDLGPTECDKVTFRIRKLPKETPKDEGVFLVGNFNDWQPGNPEYKFKRNEPDQSVYVDLPKANQEIEFKLTRGDWTSEEADINGERIPNRKFVFGSEDTVDLEVGGWIDLNPGIEEREVTFIVQTPLGTPPTDPVYIVGNFNHWVPGDPAYELKKMGPNLFGIKLRKPEGEMEYKFTRGRWGYEEVDIFGNHISNRKLRTSADTVHITIPEWLDIPLDQTFTLNRDEMNFIMENPDVIGFPVNKNKGEKAVKFTLTTDLKTASYVYLRVVLPSAPNNRNYGVCDLVKPGQSYKMVCPEGAIFYVCDGPYWNDNRPNEKKLFVVTKEMEGKLVKPSPIVLK